MKLSQVKEKLKTLDHITFQLPNKGLVPPHFHITEVGKISKNFIDCGGTVRREEVVNFQLWASHDYDHRLQPEKLLNIIELAEKVLKIEDLEIEVEYQGETISKFGLEFNDSHFSLTTKDTNCLAKDKCGIPSEKPKIKFSEVQATNDCRPNSGCC